MSERRHLPVVVFVVCYTNNTPKMRDQEIKCLGAFETWDDALSSAVEMFASDARKMTAEKVAKAPKTEGELFEAIVARVDCPNLGEQLDQGRISSDEFEKSKRYEMFREDFSISTFEPGRCAEWFNIVNNTFWQVSRVKVIAANA